MNAHIAQNIVKLDRAIGVTMLDIEINIYSISNR